MPVPSTVADLSATASSNSPAGSDAIGTTLDDYLRSHAAIIRQVSDAKVSAGPATSSGLTVSATDKVLGRLSSGSGAIEEITCTAAGRALIDDADAATQRQTLGIGNGGAVNTASNVVVLDGSSKLPAVDGSQLTGVSAKQIQPISASVGSNALTISASALSLDFRSTTLGSGTVTTVSGTPANLVISSGSTLGTVNAVQSDIAVLAINNAGTIELAAVNLAGGTQLDETNLISTTAEGGAGAADSSTVVYSTTARTNVAYRVLGIIRSTQTTAGTWATAPSLIQGQGGNAGLQTAFSASGPAPMYACRAWVNFNGTGTVSIRGSGNVSSITDNGAGNYTANFTSAMPDANYAVEVSMQKDGATGNETGPSLLTRTTTGVQVVNIGYDSVYRDSSVVCVSVFR